MINAIIGRPRSGKSYEAVRYHIFPALEEGRMVVTNIPLDVEYFVRLLGEEVEDLIELIDFKFDNYGEKMSARFFSQAEHYTRFEWRNNDGVGPLFVVDEAHLVLGRDAPKAVLEYYSMHGHYGVDILLMSQSHGKIHRDIKDMIEVCWRTIKMDAYGDQDHYIKKTYHGIATRTADYIHEEERSYDAKYFPMYKSHTQSDTAVKEQIANDVAQGGLNPHKKRNIIIMSFAVLLVIFAMTRFFGSADEVEKEVESKSIPNSAPVNYSVPGTNKNSVPGASQNPAPVYVPPLPRQNQHSLYAKRSKEFHPFYKVSLHISGSLSVRGNGRVRDIITFDASQRKQVLFTMDSEDLYKAGYTVEVLSPCSVRVAYYDFEDYIVCDSPAKIRDKNKGEKISSVF